MTREKKRQYVDKYCMETKCSECVLKDKKYNWKSTYTHKDCICTYDSPEEDLDKAIKLIQESQDLDKAHDINKLAESVTNLTDNVNHPNHYQGKNECIDVMVAMFGIEAVKHFCMCNAYKYRFRSNMKNGEEDIKKAEWYEDKLIELGGIR